MTRKPFPFASAIALLTLSACGNTDAIKTAGTLGGSSVGAAVSQAIGASGPWGYVASIASTAVGGFAGNMVTRLFLPDTTKSIKTALETALNEPATGKVFEWGPTGKPPSGIVATTGSTFTSPTGAKCRPFTMSVGMPAPAPVAPTPEEAKTADSMAAITDATAKVGSAAKVTSQVSKIGGESTAGIGDAAGDVGNVAGKMKDASKILGGFSGKKKITESFGAACMDGKGIWQTVKA
jgi:surface antigen